MKTLAKISVGMCVAFVAAIPVYAIPVTFQVNMSAQTALGNFNPTTDTVNVAGDAINSWSTSASPLSSSSADTNIWTGTFDLTGTAGTTVQYKYVINAAGGTVTWEGNVGAGGGTGNRSFALAATAQTLPVVYFNNVTSSTSVTNQITFQVDMSVQISLGNFDPANFTVNLAGEFNGWNTTSTPMTNSPTDTNLWFVIVPLSGGLGTSVAYKYVMNTASGVVWEGNVGPAGSQNRSLTLERTNQILSAVYFDNKAAQPVPTPLAFQVDLTVQVALGNFNPTTDYVEARGSFNNNWAAGFTLTNSPDNTNIYSGTFVDTSDVVGNSIGYKFVLNGATWETAINNRTYTLTSTNEQTLPLVFFNDINNLGPISIQPTTPGQAALSWTAGPLVRLQNAASLLNATWQDVPNTQGSNSVTLPIGPNRQFFRLTGP
jgi:starch binding protein with CBM20 domain/predicted carbohydrate-binding protein with CBM48